MLRGFCPGGSPVFLPPQKPTCSLNILTYLLSLIFSFQCKYARLKKKTRFPEHMAINDSEWIRSSDDLLMWERNLRASEVKTTNGVSSRPVNDKRTWSLCVGYIWGEWISLNANAGIKNPNEGKFIREFKQWRPRPRGRRLVKYEFHSQLSRFVESLYWSRNLLKLNFSCQPFEIPNKFTKNWIIRRCSRSSNYAEHSQTRVRSYLLIMSSVNLYFCDCSRVLFIRLQKPFPIVAKRFVVWNKRVG